MASTRFQCSSASRKFLNGVGEGGSNPAPHVSVLFSEPKIPQFPVPFAERITTMFVSVLFSEPKIPQFNAAQAFGKEPHRFQCSSASRKFLNSASAMWMISASNCFSALQRAENSSMAEDTPLDRHAARVSVLFSEPKIPQCRETRRVRGQRRRFSALQRAENSSMLQHRCNFARARGFSALQRAENSSISCVRDQRRRNMRRFSALQRAENSSIAYGDVSRRDVLEVSVLFSEPKIPQ